MAHALKLHLLLLVNIQIVENYRTYSIQQFYMNKTFLEITYPLRNWKALGK